MTLTDEEAREIIRVFRSEIRCPTCGGHGEYYVDLASEFSPPEVPFRKLVSCASCDGTGIGTIDARCLKILLESRIGQPDRDISAPSIPIELPATDDEYVIPGPMSAAYQFGFERRRDAGRKERG